MHEFEYDELKGLSKWSRCMVCKSKSGNHSLKWSKMHFQRTQTQTAKRHVDVEEHDDKVVVGDNDDDTGS